MRNRYFLLLDVLGLTLSVFIAFTARFEGWGWWPELASAALIYVGIAVPLKVIGFLGIGLYSRLWKYASIADLELLMAGTALGAAIAFAVGIGVIPLLHLHTSRIPIGVLLMDSMFTAATITIGRLLVRVADRRRYFASKGGPIWMRRRADEHRRALIVGAGWAGGMIAQELIQNRQLGLVPVGFVDDDKTKHGHHLHGLRVWGSLADIEEVVKRLAIDEVITALPSARGRVVREVMQRSAAVGARNRTVPGLFELISGAKAVNALRPIQIEDLLRRDPIQANLKQVSSLATGRTVLVTGAGGSIGSELCRQIARLGPKKIVAVGRGENSIFELLEELRSSFPTVPVRPVIVDVRDEARLAAVFREERPFSVFHAAAHKHVPLMEASVDEAILNNVLGTRNVAELSSRHGTEHLVLISTDKAVRPTSIMGATKRIAEEIVSIVAERTKRPYVAVRFGNVLGSRGSVVPTFLRQIAKGGPVTITHPEMRRYFMTIPEAVQLVLQAGALGRGGEVFVLDMGEPVRIADLAEDLIRLSGLEVGSDIEIQYTGMRPGEKLYEELFFGPDDATPTSSPKILKARDSSVGAELEPKNARLIDAARDCAPVDELRRMTKQLVPEYQPPKTVAEDLEQDGGYFGPAESVPARRTPTMDAIPAQKSAAS
jgi:FlaA1/EpsC-like NDP-sugar epimerase